MMPSLIRALGRHARRGMTMSEVMKKNHPEEPHWYLG